MTKPSPPDPPGGGSELFNRGSEEPVLTPAPKPSWRRPTADRQERFLTVAIEKDHQSNIAQLFQPLVNEELSRDDLKIEVMDTIRLKTRTDKYAVHRAPYSAHPKITAVHRSPRRPPCGLSKQICQQRNNALYLEPNRSRARNWSIWMRNKRPTHQEHTIADIEHSQ